MTAVELRSVDKASLTPWATRATPILFAAGLGLLAVGGAWFLWRASARYGIGIGPDSVVYISGARHWLAGQGISWVTGGMQVDPIIHYPPLFPLLLAGMQLLGVDVLQAARLVNVLAYGLNAAVLGWVLHRITGGYLLPLAGAALMLVSPGIFSLHADGMTDGLYLVLTSIALYFMSRHLRDGGLRALFVSAIAGGLAYLLRYAGIALILVLGLGLVLGSRGRWRETLRAAAIFAGVSIAPMGVFYVRNLRLAGVTSDVRLLAHGQHGLAFADGYRMVLDWFLPGLIVQRVTAIPLLAPLLVVGLALAALVYGVGVLRRRWAWRPSNTGEGELLGLHAIHFGPYLLFLYFSSALVFPPATISERTLAPAFLSALVLLVGGLAWVTRERPWIVRVFIGLLLAGLIYNKSIWTLGLADRLRQQGQGYTSAAWLASETLAAVDELNPTLIYSNEIPAIYLRLDRYANDLPEEVEAPRAEIHPNHETIGEYRRRLRQTPGAVVVLFNRWGVSPDDEAFEPFTRGLMLVGAYSDGAIYRASSE